MDLRVFFNTFSFHLHSHLVLSLSRSNSGWHHDLLGPGVGPGLLYLELEQHHMMYPDMTKRDTKSFGLRLIFRKTMCDSVRHLSFLRYPFTKGQEMWNVPFATFLIPGWSWFLQFFREMQSKQMQQYKHNEPAISVLLCLYKAPTSRNLKKGRLSNLFTCQPNAIWAAAAPPISLVKFWNMGNPQLLPALPISFLSLQWLDKGNDIYLGVKFANLIAWIWNILKDVWKAWASYKNGDVHQRVPFVGKRGWPLILSRGWEKSTSWPGMGSLSWKKAYQSPDLCRKISDCFACFCNISLEWLQVWQCRTGCPHKSSESHKSVRWSIVVKKSVRLGCFRWLAMTCGCRMFSFQ